MGRGGGLDRAERGGHDRGAVMSAHGGEVMKRIGRAAQNVVRVFRRKDRRRRFRPKHEPPAGPKLERGLRARFRRFRDDRWSYPITSKDIVTIVVLSLLCIASPWAWATG